MIHCWCWLDNSSECDRLTARVGDLRHAVTFQVDMLMPIPQMDTSGATIIRKAHTLQMLDMQFGQKGFE